MITVRTLLTRLLPLVAPLLLVAFSQSPAQTYRFRAANLVRGTTAIDLSVGSQSNYLTNLAYEALSGRSASFPAGSTTVRVTNAGTPTVLAERTDTLLGDRIYTFLAYGSSASARLAFLPWRFDQVAPVDYALVRVFNASSAGALDVYFDSTGGDPVFAGVMADSLSPYITMQAHSVSLIVTAAGSKTAIARFVAPIASRSIQTLVIEGSGSADLGVHVLNEGSAPVDPTTIVTLQREQAQGATPTLRFVHAFPPSEARSLDVYINGATRAASGVTYRSASAVLPNIGVGPVTMTLVPADRSPNDSVYGTSLTLSRDTAYSLVLTEFRSGAPISLTLTRSLSEAPPAPGKAKVRLANVTDFYTGLSFSFTGGTTQTLELPQFLTVTDWMEIDTGALNLQVFKPGVTSPILQGSAHIAEGEFVTMLAIGDDAAFAVDLLRHTVQGAQQPLESFGAQQSAVRESATIALGLRSMPNPIVGDGIIRFELPSASDVRLDLFDELGRRIATLSSGRYDAGAHTVTLAGSAIAPGAYTAVLRTAGATEATRVVVVR
jgi:hypothetical protein